jgi:Helix-turn-helix domain
VKKSHRLVLLEIANHTNSEGLAWPSYRTLIAKTGLSRRRVIDIVADLRGVGELEVLPHGSPHGGQAYRIPGGATIAPGMESSGAKNDTEGVQPLHPNLLIESLYLQNETDDKDEWLTHEQAVKIGLTPGSRLYRLATGEAQPEA